MRNVNLGQFDLRDLLSWSSLRRRLGRVGWRLLLLSLVSWLLLIPLVLILVVATSATALSSSAPSEVLVVLLIAAASRSVVEFVSSIAAHIVHWILLRV